jgi:hypothetical protein
VCLHALSSFQRTDRPVIPGMPGGVCSLGSPCPFIPCAARFVTDRRQGNLLRLLDRRTLVNKYLPNCSQQRRLSSYSGVPRKSGWFCLEKPLKPPCGIFAGRTSSEYRVRSISGQDPFGLEPRPRRDRGERRTNLLGGLCEFCARSIVNRSLARVRVRPRDHRSLRGPSPGVKRTT